MHRATNLAHKQCEWKHGGDTISPYRRRSGRNHLTDMAFSWKGQGSGHLDLVPKSEVLLAECPP